MTAPTQFDQLVDNLVGRTGIPRDRAEVIIAQNRPDLAPKLSDAERERDARIRENAEQVEVIKLFRRYGFKARSTSQSRPSKIALGIPDLILVHRARGFALFWETKRQVGGVQSEEQQEFESDCRLAGWTYRMGDRYDAARYLINVGLAREGDGALGIVPVDE